MANYEAASTIRRKAAMFLVIFNFPTSTVLPRIFGPSVRKSDGTRLVIFSDYMRESIARWIMPEFIYILLNCQETNPDIDCVFRYNGFFNLQASKILRTEA